jgi:CRISPR system Cascade subunit CasA
MSTIENRFNLVDEQWVPVAGEGLVSLKSIFTRPELRALGGNPVQKIAMTKLLLAICQASYTPTDEPDWANLGSEGMSKKAAKYLEEKRDCFWLYGERPFLQMPTIIDKIEERKKSEMKVAKKEGDKKIASENAMPRPFGMGVYPDVSSDNNTILTYGQIDRQLDDAEIAIFIVTLMNFALAGKRVEKNIPPFSSGYSGKSVSAKPGPSIGNYIGYLHSYLIGGNIQETLWFNILSHEQINQNANWTSKLGPIPWQTMPIGEDCEIAKQLKNSYMGCLIAISRFVLADKRGIYYIEGLQYPSHKDGWREPSIAIKETEKGAKLLWADVEKKPWRELTSLLAFSMTQQNNGFNCFHINAGIPRIRKVKSNGPIGIWSGALKVRPSSGDQSVKQDDDFVSSETNFELSYFNTGFWFTTLTKEMDQLQELANKNIYGSTIGFYKALKSDGKLFASQASNLFWQLAERKFQELVNACGSQTPDEALKPIRKIFASFAETAYNTYCPRESARQLDAWAANRPNLGKYLSSI